MKIIVFEGLDKSGKHTASLNFENKLKDQGYRVAKMEFPQYDSPIGQLIRDWLHNELDVDAHTFELLLAADKQSAQTKIQEFKDSGYDYLIMDRYIHSQLAYGSYDNDASWVESLIKYTCKPDFVIYMDVSPDESMKRQGQHGDNDRYESDYDRLSKMSDAYNMAFAMTDMGDHLIRIDANQSLSNVSKALTIVADHISSILDE